MPSRLRDCGSALLAAAAVTLTAGGAPGAATGPTPTLTAATQVNGSTSSAPLVSGSWNAGNDGAWTADLTSVAPPTGATTVTATWRSAPVPARPRTRVFAVDVVVNQEPAPGTYAYRDEVRVCTGRTCGPWITDARGGLPAWIDPAALPFTVAFGHGIALTWRGTRRTVTFQWRYRQVQQDGNYARTTLRVAAGAAAART